MSEKRKRSNKRRRDRQLRVRVSAFVAMVLIVFGMSFVVGSLHSNAQDQERPVTFKYFKSVMVEYGQSIYDIGTDLGISIEDMDEYVNEVVHINSLKSADLICAGQYIVVPYYSDEFLR